jgi:signal recognition particle GTPase
VALPVVRTFVDQVKAKALGEEVLKSLTPGQVLIKIVNDELVKVMGESNASLHLAAQPLVRESYRQPRATFEVNPAPALTWNSATD